MEPFVFDSRPSDVPLVDVVWRSQSTQSGTFMSIASAQTELVVTTYQGTTSLTVRGPESKGSPAPVPADATFFGIVFKLGTYLPALPTTTLVDAPVTLPDACNRSFWLHGSTWQLPDFENVDTFLNRLIRKGMLAHEPLVGDALDGRLPDLSLRSVQRRFLHATGLTQGAVYQINRARRALNLLEGGMPILDVVYMTGYADQPHLTRAMRQFTGLTPTQIQSRAFVHSA